MDQLEEIKSKIDIVSLVSEHMPLKKAGRNFRGLCPFHTEKTPSFMVSPERQMFKCFGCQKSGDIFTFLMEMERMDFGEALRILAKRAGVVLKSYRPAGAEAEREKLLLINKQSAEFFHYLLVNHPVGKKALGYILGRGIAKKSLQAFKIGYAPNMWDGLQKYLVGKKKEKVEDLEKAGLVISNQRSVIGDGEVTTDNQSPITNNRHYYDRFRDRLMFPLNDHRGNTVGFAGRVLDPNIKEAKYVNTPETILYHKSELLYPLNITKEAIKKENSVILVEGELDAISCYQVGIENVAAIKGSALTEYQARLIHRFTENAVLALDTDSAGDMATRRGIEIADKVGLGLKVMELEKYKDPDEAAQKEPEYLVKKIKDAVSVYDFVIDSAFKRLRGTTAEEKKKVGIEVLPIITGIQDEIQKSTYVKKLANRLEVAEDAVILQLEKLNQPIMAQSTPVASATATRDRRVVLEEYWLALLFQTNQPELLAEKRQKDLINSAVYLKIIDCLKDYRKDRKKFSSRLFYRVLPAELREAFDKLYLVDFGDLIEDEAWVKREIDNTEKQLRDIATKDELIKLTAQLRAEVDENKSAEIREKIRDVGKKLFSR